MVCHDIVAVGHPDWYGVRRALCTYTDTFISALDIPTAQAALRERRPRVVLFGCYLPEWEPILRTAHELHCVTVFTWYASYTLGEFDVANRVLAHEALLAHRAGLFTCVATPHVGMMHTLRALGVRVDLLPLTINAERILQTPLSSPIEDTHIGIFGSGQPWKNMEVQIVAAHLVPNATVHIQHGPRKRSAIQTFDIPVIRHATTLSDDDYYSLLGQMTINLSVSLSETYSYLTAESLLLGTPVLTSHLTPVLHGLPDNHPLQLCRTAAFDDPWTIAKTISRIIERRSELVGAGREHMWKYNEQQYARVDDLIARWFACQ